MANAIVALLYVMANVSYLSVLGVSGLLGSDAVGSSFAKSSFSGLDKAIPPMIIVAIFSTNLANCFTTPRVWYVAGREGQLPKMLSMIHVRRLTPVVAVLFNGYTSF